MPPDAPPLVERFGTLNLPLGGKQGYENVRGKQGAKRNEFQGYTPQKTHFTKTYKSAKEAAVNLALLKRELENNSEEEEEKKPRKARKVKKVTRHARSPCPLATCTLTHVCSNISRALWQVQTRTPYFIIWACPCLALQVRQPVRRLF